MFFLSILFHSLCCSAPRYSQYWPSYTCVYLSLCLFVPICASICACVGRYICVRACIFGASIWKTVGRSIFVHNHTNNNNKQQQRQPQLSAVQQQCTLSWMQGFIFLASSWAQSEGTVIHPTLTDLIFATFGTDRNAVINLLPSFCPQHFSFSFPPLFARHASVLSRTLARSLYSAFFWPDKEYWPSPFTFPRK